MMNARIHPHTVYRVILWTARILSALLVAFTLLFVIGESATSNGGPPSGGEWLGLALFPFGVCVGLIVGWRWQVLGAVLCLGFLAAFCLWLFLAKGDRDIPSPLLAFCVPAALYLVYGLGTRWGADKG